MQTVGNIAEAAKARSNYIVKCLQADAVGHDMDALKRTLQVSQAAAACHTAVCGVPAALLAHCYMKVRHAYCGQILVALTLTLLVAVWQLFVLARL